MTLQQLAPQPMGSQESSSSAPEPLTPALDRDEIARFLDKAIPLREGSHTDIIAYGVHVPMRYSECFALTRDGQKIELSDRHRFRGWAGQEPVTSLLFEYDDSQLELLLAPHAHGLGWVHDINLVCDGPDARLRRKQYIGVDGSTTHARKPYGDDGPPMR